jgi:hypothetical protein
VATGPTGTFPNPWAGGNVYFYYIHPDLGAFFVSVVNGNVFMVEDDGMTTRSYTWTTTFDALGIPAAATPGQFVAVAVASGSRYATPPNGSVLVVTGALGGDG